jgi:endoglucanase
MLALAVLAACVPAAQASYYSGVATPGNPLAGHPWFVDREFGVWWDVMRQQPLAARPLHTEADTPMTKTFGAFEPHPEVGLRRYLARAATEEPGAIPFISLSRIEHQSCPYVRPGSDFSEGAVDNWVSRFSQAIGDYPVMVLVEADKLAVMACLPGAIQDQRYRELRYEVRTLHAHNPNAIVYLDAGASDWVGWDQMARELRRADVADTQGFALGASHFDWTRNEVAYGLKISRALHGAHFVINTNSNGWGPRPRFHSRYYHGGCTPPGEGIGYRPSVVTPDRHIDAYLWLGTPGFESGACLGQGTSYGFRLPEAISLVANANPGLAPNATTTSGH